MKRPGGGKGRARRDRAGRVHLTLHRDPGGGDQVTLTAPLFAEAWQNEIAEGAANTAHAVIGGESAGAPTLESAVELARNAMAATQRLIDGLLARAPVGAVACRAGCDHCCYQRVGVTPPEALAIFDHLSQTLSDEELQAITAHVAARHAATQGLSGAERFSPDHPCPFLDTGSGRCTIYEVRPLSCRGMNSLDAGECARRLREPAARAAFLADGLGSHSFMEPIRAFHAVSAGLQLALSELHGLDMRPLELTAAMHLLLNGAPSLPDQWIAGQASFASARTDENDAPGLRELGGVLSPPR
jgi:Fe-S-cluster containining protein